MAKAFEAIVPAEREGERLDVFAAELADVTRSRALSLIRDGNVLVEGAPITDEVLKELVGHPPMEVFFGALTGALVALIWLNV